MTWFWVITNCKMVLLLVLLDISREFERLQHAATVLGLPNPNSINWTLVVSSTSDSAANQKRIDLSRSAEKMMSRDLDQQLLRLLI